MVQVKRYEILMTEGSSCGRQANGQALKQRFDCRGRGVSECLITSDSMSSWTRTIGPQIARINTETLIKIPTLLPTWMRDPD